MLKSEKFFFCGVSNLRQFEEILNLEPGGILLYPDIFQDQSVFLEVISHLKNSKLLLSTDHEGGQLEVIPFIPQSPGNLLFGKVQPILVERYCNMAGKFMKTLGMNMVFAPVLDLKFEFTNQVIGYRSFGDDPNVVAQMAVAAIKGYRSAGISSCAKHFPGHGRTHQDSHEEFTFCDASVDELQKDLYPFKVAIQSNVESIMMAHVVYPSIDNKPASISAKFIEEILRQEMNYQGIVISDAVEMNSLAKFYSPEEIVNSFFNSSGDMIIISDPSNLKIYSQIFSEQVNAGKIHRSKLKKSLERIEALSGRIETDLSLIFEAIEMSTVFNVEVPKDKSFVLLVPDSSQWSKADVSYKYIETIKSQASTFLGAKIMPFGQHKSIQSGQIVLDLILDLSEEEIQVHRELSKNLKVIYLITRNPFLKKYFEDKDHVITYSLSPVVMGYVFRRLAKLSKGGVKRC